MINTWTTANGANIELHTKHLTTESYTTDWGQEKEKAIDHIMIDKVIINSKVYTGSIGRKTFQNTRVLDCGRDYQAKKLIYVPLPADVEKEVWGAYDARQKAKYAAEKAIRNRDAESLAKKEARGYCSKCGSYCYGDCES